MKKQIILFFLCGLVLFDLACGSNYDSSTKSPDSSIDTLTVKSKEPLKIVENSNQILQNYVHEETDTLKKDTVFNYKGRKLKILFRHYCTFDSLLLIPEKYVGIYGIKLFKTHNFQSVLKIYSENKIMIDTIITKNIFSDFTYDEEKKYGTLLYPVLTFQANSLKIDYSISIPLTDVGIAAILECNYNGRLMVKAE